MTPTTIKIAVGLALLTAWSWFMYHQGSLAPKLAAATAIVEKEAVEIKQEQKQEVTNNQAEAQHDQDIEHPAPLIIKQPVWLRQPAICLPFPAQAPDPSPAPRPVDPGPGIDLRPQLAAFVTKYENALSDCRRMAAEWP